MSSSFLLVNTESLRDLKALQDFVLARAVNLGGSWEPANLPVPDKGWEDLTGLCPFVGQLTLLATRLGISERECTQGDRKFTFCGSRVSHEDNFGPLGGRQGFAYTPWPFCWRLLLAFTWALEQRKNFRSLKTDSLKAGVFRLASLVWGLQALSLGDGQIRDAIGLSEGNPNCLVSPKGDFQGRQS